MIVCSCLGVSAAELEEVVEQGADTVDAVGAVCGAGTDCGACRAQVSELIAIGRLVAHRSSRGTCVHPIAPSEYATEGSW